MRNRKYPIPQLSGNLDGPDYDAIEGYITVSEAADFLRRTISGVYNLKHRGRIRGYKLGGKLLFKKSELDWCVKSSNRGGF